MALLKREDGTVHDVVHLGRQANALQRTYLEAMGWHCARPGCQATSGLEIDHVDDWAATYRTEVDKLALLCGHDHDLKTHHGVPPHRPTPPGPDPGGARPPPPRRPPRRRRCYSGVAA